jgi:ferric-dicitrate binding protein FerR (iron transport regulator)
MTQAPIHRSRRDDETVARLAELVRGTAEAPIDAELDRAGRARLSLNVRRELEKRARHKLLPATLAAAAIVALGLLVAHLWPKPLAYEVRGAELDGPYVSATATPVTVEFSDGSVVRADPGSRLRVDEPSSRGARVLVERGRAAVNVTQRYGSAWSFLGGPFEVRVTGTRFELDWDPASEVLELEMRQGTVEVRGPIGGAVSVHAGQRFRAELASRRMMVADAADEDGTSAKARPSAPQPAAEEERPSVRYQEDE